MVDDFDAPELDRDVWLPHYLPAWSSRAATAAAYRIEDSCLVLELPPGAGAWLPEDHPTPLRVSGVQSGSRSGEAGSTDGQQAVFAGQVVREAQPAFRGHLQSGGRVAVRCAMELSHRSMAALWLCGYQEAPGDSGELCVVEVFGDAVVAGASAEVGVGVKAIHDPRLRDDFAAPRLPVDVAAFHEYAVEWDAEEAVFCVDGEVVRRCAGPPAYPLQLMVAVFDFPDRTRGDDDHLVPRLRVDRVEGTGPTVRRRRAIESGSAFEADIGYARAVVDGDHVHVSGTTGFDYATMTIADDVVAQCEQALRNVEAALAQAGCTLADVVRVRYLLPDREDFEPCWPVLRAAFGTVRPAATMQQCGLADPRMRVEIEVDARRR